ncbi:hypothetical protein AB5N19_05217 [Seiridium cardinale]|uniref:Uncharacterized protein n=1 Tax=Seiridium cardinale TaxID=138064 RepID=A0ABR2XI71_9PEZI
MDAIAQVKDTGLQLWFTLRTHGFLQLLSTIDIRDLHSQSTSMTDKRTTGTKS